MGSSEIDDVESQVNARISRVNEDYVALPGSSEAAVAATESQEGSSYAPQQRRHLSVNLAVTIFCFAAVLFGTAAFISYNSPLPSGGGLSEDSANGDGDNEFSRAAHTGYHFQPERYWMNDPNAPLFYKGYYHFFYQCNNDAAYWGPISWGHAVSTDLVNWLYLDNALDPDQWYDLEGVWSGSATILQDGTPALMYTGGRRIHNNTIIQSQSLALSADPSDPLLREWKKIDGNPIIEHPWYVGTEDFRDPTTAWLEKDGYWRLAIGTKRENADGSMDGYTLLYKSTDFINWEKEEMYLHEVPGSGMWECVDFFPITVKGKSLERGAENYVDTYKYVLKASLDREAHDYYTIGTYNTDTHKFSADDPALDMGLGFRYDYGKFYASKSFYDASTGRRILWSWVNESDSRQDDVTKGWASIQAIPRTLWLDGKTNKNLLQWPVEEVDGLRGDKTSFQNIELAPSDVLKVQGCDGPQLDIVINFERPNVSMVDVATPDVVKFDCSQGGSANEGMFGPFGLLVLADEELTEHTGVFFYISPLAGGEWVTFVCSDQSRSSLAPDLDMTTYGSTVTVLPDENELSLRILVDHSVVESFVQGGRLAITSRVYPMVALGSNSHLFLFNNGSMPIRVNSMDVYHMDQVKMTTY